MLELRQVIDNLADVKAALARKGFNDGAIFERLEALAAARKKAIADLESLQQERNAATKRMAAIADKKSEAFANERGQLRQLGDRVKELDIAKKEVETEINTILLEIPNPPTANAPDGKSEKDNVELRVWGDKPSFDFEPKDHATLGQALDVIDFERAAKVSGSRFAVLKAGAAQLERALIQFMLDLHTEAHGYTEVWVPTLVKDSAMLGTTQLPKFAKDSFVIAKDEEWAKNSDAEQHDLYLCPTGEVPITNLHADEIIDGGELPIAYCGYTACFRSEAGSYGKDTKGLIRQHQFDKVELVRFCGPEDAEAQHEALTNHAEKVLQTLKLHHRVMDLCTGDMSFGAKRCFDIEVWLPGQNAYREISSCSWFGDFQARRMNARYRPRPKEKPKFLHTINGSALAVGRTLVAIFEQYQNADGSITIPDALQPYMRGKKEL